MFKIFAKVKQTNNNSKRMETTKVKLTDKQAQELDSQMYEIVSECCKRKNQESVTDECEVEIDGETYYIEYWGSYDSWETSPADWYSEAEYDEYCRYQILSCERADENGDYVQVETGREEITEL